MSSRYFTNSFVRRDQEQYAKKLKMPKGSTAELKRAYLDVNFFNLPEIRALSRKFSRKSTICLIEIYLSMSAAEGARIDEDAILSIIEPYDLDCPTSFIDYCLEKSLIKLFREKISDESQKETIISGSESRLPDSDSDNDNEYELIKEMDTPEIRSEVNKFAAKIKRDSNGRRELHQQTLDNWQSEYLGNPAAFLAALKNTNSKTFALNLIRDEAPIVKQPKKSQREILQEMMEADNATE